MSSQEVEVLIFLILYSLLLLAVGIIIGWGWRRHKGNKHEINRLRTIDKWTSQLPQSQPLYLVKPPQLVDWAQMPGWSLTDDR